MFKQIKDIKFSKSQKEKLKEYLNEEWFRDLNNKVNMYDEEASIDEKIENIMKYIMYYCKTAFGDEKEAIDNFLDLLAHYKIGEYREPIRDEDGLIELKKSGFNSGNAYYTGKLKPTTSRFGKGAFLNGILITTDRKEFLKKETMDSDGRMHTYKHHDQSRYNGTIAHEVFEYFGEESANYLPATTVFPSYYVISKNFLSENQELINFEDFFHSESADTHSDILKLLENNIRIRYKNNINEEEYNQLINKLKAQYIRQAFLKKIIGLGDEQPKNIGIVLTTDGEEIKVPEINISPAFDLDMSFNLEEEIRMRRIKTDNGQTDIKSFIEEFADFKGFREFMDMVTRKMEDEETAIETILDRSYEASKATYFLEEESRTDYKNYLKARFRETRGAYQEIFMKPEREEKDDTEAILE